MKMTFIFRITIDEAVLRMLILMITTAIKSP